MQYRSEFSDAISHRFPLLAAGATLTLLTMSACQEATKQPVIYRIDVPEPNHVQAQIELTQRIGLGLAGDFNIDLQGTRYGRVFFEPETQTHGFILGLDLNLGIFVPENVGSFEKTTTLPTGQRFSSWVQSPMVALTIPEANTPELAWNFYFGTQGRIAFGAAATISAINGSFPSLSLEYAFRDKQGRMILGVQFYGPGRDANGQAVPGGIFIGTDLTDLVPRQALSYLPAGSTTSELISSSPAKRLKIQGKSAFREFSLRGRDAGQYQQSPEHLRTVISRMLDETRK
jgi:hypothetical protein